MVQEISVVSQDTLTLLAQKWIGVPLEQATPQHLASLAQTVANEDLLQYATAIRATAQLLPAELDREKLVLAHVEHLLWVEHRKALWRSGRINSSDSVACSLRFEGLENLEATVGFPTILVMPMMLAYEDALWLTHVLSGSREVALYGEGLINDSIFAEIGKVLDLSNIRLVGTTPASVRSVLRVLRHNGFFLTYPDFVYRGHKVQHANFFGMKWPFSSSFIALCASPGNMLLPCFLRREANDLTMHFAPPVEVPQPEEAIDRRWVMHMVGASVASLLEEMILSNPAQWLLLLTLVAKAEQRAE